VTTPGETTEPDAPRPRPDTGGGDGNRAAWLVSAGILLSRVAGLVRERVIARYLGVGPAVDAFRAALRIPNLLQNLLGEGVLSASFIPVYSRLLGEGKDEEAGRVAGAVAGLLAAVAGVLVVVGVVFARPLTLLLAPGFSGDRLDLTVTLMRILTPGVGVLVLSAWCLGVLNSHRRFFLSYVAPVLWNAVQIGVVVAAAMAGASDRGLAVALAWGALAGGVAQFAVQIPGVLAVTGGVRPTLEVGLAGVGETMRRFVPVLAGRGVVQLLAYVDLLLASLLATGAVAVLGFAQIFYLLPISLFGMSVAAAELPELSRLGPDHDPDAVRRRLEVGLGRIAFYVAPVAVAYVAMGDLIVGVLLGTGEFGAAETRLVWMVLGAYSLGLVATTATRLLQSTAFARGDVKGPAAIAALRVVLAAGIGALLMFPLDRVGVSASGLIGLDSMPVFAGPLAEAVRESPDALRLGAAGLALGAGLTTWLEAGLLRRRLGAVGQGLKLGGPNRVAIAAGGLAAGVVAAIVRLSVLDLPTLAALLLAGLPAAGAYLAVTWRLGHPEAADLLARLRRSRA
jgi:putative peptidoglycan lipid II flippase